MMLGFGITKPKKTCVMKKTITLLLCLLIIALPLKAGDAPQHTKDTTFLLAALVVTAAVVATVVVIKVYSTLPSDTRPVTLVLEENTGIGWHAIATNTVTLNGTNALAFFSKQMSDPMAMYRAKKL